MEIDHRSLRPPGQSGGLLFAGERKALLLQPSLEHRDPVVAPELLAAENADRNAEDPILLALLLGFVIVATAIILEIDSIVPAGHAKRLDEALDCVNLVDREFTAEEQ